jgi:hypothetical protein
MKNLLVSFSGGETSAFMAQWLNNHYEELGYENIVFVFANTGLENEQTLEFVERCDKHFGWGVQWIEAEVYQGMRKQSGYYMTDFDNASRKGEPFESVIKKYGIPNQAFPHCTRELKQSPIKAFSKQWFNGEKYHTAIGIRIDEMDRMNAKAKEMGFIYPLIDSKMIPASKPMVNFYWRSMPFRLDLKGYQGNCATCWKKSDKKLFQIAKENPDAFEFMNRMESVNGWVGPEFKKDYEGKTKRTFFRGKRNTGQILEQAKNFNGQVSDDASFYPVPNLFTTPDYEKLEQKDEESRTFDQDLVGGESCEVFSECV